MSYSKKRPTYDVFVGNIPPHASEVTLGQLFSCFGEIDRIKVMESKREGVKIAFVNFLCEPDADRAIRERNNYVYCGHPLNISRASSWLAKKEKSGPPPLQKQNNYIPGGGEPYNDYGASRMKANRGQAKPFLQLSDYGSDGGSYDKFRSEPPYQKMGCAPREEQFVLTQVESPVSFFAQILRQNQDLQRLSRNLTEICPLQTHLAGKPSPNKIYAARFTEDGQWYRCKVMSTDYYDKSVIRYIDYGNYELMAHTQMVSLPQNLASLPPMAPKCYLRNLRPVDKESYPTTFREGMMFMQSQLQERILVATLHPHADGSFEIARLILGDVDVHQHLLRYGYAVNACGPSNPRPQNEYSMDHMPPKRILDRPQPRPQQPPLERMSMNGLDLGDLSWPGHNNEMNLQRKVEELTLQLSQEKGKVKAVTAQVQRLSEQTKVGDPYEKLETVLEDVKRVCLLRRKVPILPGEPDYLEEAYLLSTDQPLERPTDTPYMAVIQRVLDGIEEVYGDLLNTKSYNNDTFPIDELVAYYRRLKQMRKSKCVPLGAETDAARTALTSASISLTRALQSVEAFPCHFGKALDKLRRCSEKELAARALEVSDVAVLALMARFLKTTLTSKLKEENSLDDLAQKLKKMPKLKDVEVPPPEEPVPPLPLAEEMNKSKKETFEEEDSDDDCVNDLSSLRQKICSLPSVAGRN